MNNRHIVGIVVIAVVVLLNLPIPTSERIRSGSSDTVEPFQSLSSLISYKVRGWFKDSPEEVAASDSVEDLKARIADYELRMDSVRSLEEENRELRDVLKFQQRSRARLIPAEVISRNDISGWWKTIRLDRGVLDGVETNMAVMSVKGLIGRVAKVSKSTCDVVLISDSGTRVSVKFPDGKLAGVLQGKGVDLEEDYPVEVLFPMSRMTVEYIDKTIELEDGTEVYTSGLGGVFPADIKVGVIRNPRLHESSLFYTAALTPADPMNDLRFVLIMASAQREGGAP